MDFFFPNLYASYMACGVGHSTVVRSSLRPDNQLELPRELTVGDVRGEEDDVDRLLIQIDNECTICKSDRNRPSSGVDLLPESK